MSEMEQVRDSTHILESKDREVGRQKTNKVWHSHPGDQRKGQGEVSRHQTGPTRDSTYMLASIQSKRGQQAVTANSKQEL